MRADVSGSLFAQELEVTRLRGTENTPLKLIRFGSCRRRATKFPGHHSQPLAALRQLQRSEVWQTELPLVRRPLRRTTTIRESHDCLRYESSMCLAPG